MVDGQIAFDFFSLFDSAVRSRELRDEKRKEEKLRNRRKKKQPRPLVDARPFTRPGRLGLFVVSHRLRHGRVRRWRVIADRRSSASFVSSRLVSRRCRGPSWRISALMNSAAVLPLFQGLASEGGAAWSPRVNGWSAREERSGMEGGHPWMARHGFSPSVRSSFHAR